MRPTLDFLRDSFSRFNTICFGGKLPEPEFRLSNARSFMGQFRHPRVFSRERCRISLNARYDLPAEELEDVVIHEMIHYYIWHSRLRDASSHGPVFRRIMADINARHGRHISVRHTSSPEQLATDRHLKYHYVCVTRWADGRRLITVCARSCIFRINDAFLAHPPVVALEWRVSTDPWFNRFPVSRTARAYLVNESEFSHYVVPAVRCVCSGGVFKIAK